MSALRCPTCNGPTHVLETRESPSGIRRRRACRSLGCPGRVTTVEVVVHHGDPTGDVVLVPRKELTRMQALLADVLQQCGTEQP